MKLVPGFIYIDSKRNKKKCLTFYSEYRGGSLTTEVFYRRLFVQEGLPAVSQRRFCSLAEFTKDIVDMLPVTNKSYEDYNQAVAIHLLESRGWLVKRDEKFWKARKTSPQGTKSEISSTIFQEVYDLCLSMG